MARQRLSESSSSPYMVVVDWACDRSAEDGVRQSYATCRMEVVRGIRVCGAGGESKEVVLIVSVANSRIKGCKLTWTRVRRDMAKLAGKLIAVLLVEAGYNWRSCL